MYSKEELVKPFVIQGGETGILLVHGFSACPIDIKPLGERFSEWGYTIQAPLLPGHGTTPEEMKHTTWTDWVGTVDEAISQMKKKCTKVIAIGHSMGGLIVLSLASQQKLDGVVAINAPIIYRDHDLHFAERLLGKQEYAYKPQKESEISVNREGLPHFSYIKIPVESFVSLNKAITPVQNELHKIDCPALVIQSLEDKTVHPRSGRMIEKSIKHNNKEVIYWEKEDHYILLSAARDELAHRIQSFLLKYNLAV